MGLFTFKRKWLLLWLLYYYMTIILYDYYYMAIINMNSALVDNNTTELSCNQVTMRLLHLSWLSLPATVNVYARDFFLPTEKASQTHVALNWCYHSLFLRSRGLPICLTVWPWTIKHFSALWEAVIYPEWSGDCSGTKKQLELFVHRVPSSYRDHTEIGWSKK